MSLFLLPFLSAFYFLIVGSLSLRNNYKSRLAQIFFAICLTTFGWHYPSSFAFGTFMEDDAYFLFKISWCFILLLPTTIYHFFVVLSGDAKETIWVYCSYGYSLILLVIHILTNKVIAGVYIYPWGFYPKSGLFEILHIMQTFIVVSRGLYLGYVSLKKESSHQKKLQIKYCLFGFFIYLFASLDYLTNYGIIILESPPGFIFVAISLTIISYVIVRHDLLSIGAFFSVVLSKIIIYLLFLFIFLIGSVFVTGDYLHHNMNNFIMAAFCVVVLCEIYSVLLGKIRRVSDSLFTQIKKKELINKGLRINLEKLYSANEIALKLQEYFSNKLNIMIESCYILDDLSNQDKNNYINLLSGNKKPPTISVPQNLYDKIIKNESYLLNSEFKNIFAKSKEDQILIPFIFAEKILGFCLVDSKNDLESWNYDLFNSLIREVGIILDRVRIYQDFLLKKQEHIQEQERAKIYKTLAGSIAHEIRNPLNSINVISNQINDILRNMDNEIMEIANSLANSKCKNDNSSEK